MTPPDRPAQPAPDLDALLNDYRDWVYANAGLVADARNIPAERKARAAIVAEFTSLRERVAELERESVCEQKRILELGGLVMEKTARVAELEAQLAQRGETDHSHECRRCKHGYTPGPSANEDCPKCGYDGRAPRNRIILGCRKTP